jgi:hypothetical protein
MNSTKTGYIREQFYTAAKDYLYLLENGYPVKSIVKLVGDRYELSSAERVLLYRGLIKKEKLSVRSKMKCRDIPKHSKLYIDGFNVIRTIGSYLNGNFVFRSMDGFLRDVSELHRKALKREVLERSLRLVLDYLEKFFPREVIFYFDKPVSHSGKTTQFTNTEIKNRNLNGGAFMVFSPDRELKNVVNGIICTADSAIIESAKVPVFDLPSAVLTDRFSPAIFSLYDIFT